MPPRLKPENVPWHCRQGTPYSRENEGSPNTAPGLRRASAPATSGPATRAIRTGRRSMRVSPGVSRVLRGNRAGLPARAARVGLQALDELAGARVDLHAVAFLDVGSNLDLQARLELRGLGGVLHGRA